MLAALTLLVIAVPEQLATSHLAGMPPVTGLYAFVAGTVAFALLGSNPRMSVGADSTIAPIFALGIGRLAATYSPHYVALVGILAVQVGAIVALVGLLRLGWIAEFLSTPIITGFLGGVAVIIVVHQLPDLFGIPATSGSTLHRLGGLVSNLDSTNGWALGLGLAALLIIVAAERVDKRLPGAFAGLLVTTLAVAILGLHAHGVVVLGNVAHGAPHLGLKGLSLSSMRSVLPDAAIVALVVVSQSAATTRAFPGDGGGQSDVNRDFLGVGMGSILAGVTGSFPVDASPPRTAAVAAAGGRTQIAGLAAAAAIVLLIPAGHLLHDVPLTALAAVLLFIAGRIFHVGDLAAILRFNTWEFVLSIVTLFTVALVGVEQGIGVAVGLAVLDRTRLSARPKAHVMSRIPGTTSWEPVETSDRPIEVPGVVVVLFAAPLYFANADHFRGQIDRGIQQASARPGLLVLDVVGMHDIDFTGARAMKGLLEDMERRNITVAIARAGKHLRENLARSGQLQRIGPEHLFPSVDAAVVALGPEGDHDPSS
jgi:MFS superfamily sulfate permease-like transporter